MSDFTDFLRLRVQKTQQSMTTDLHTGNDDCARTHAGHLADVLEVAARNGVDTTGWVDPTVRSFVDRWS